MTNPVNDPESVGTMAGPMQFFCDKRYALAPWHTRFESVEWRATDSEQTDPVTGLAEVIVQKDTKEAALVKLLDLITRGHDADKPILEPILDPILESVRLRKQFHDLTIGEAIAHLTKIREERGNLTLYFMSDDYEAYGITAEAGRNPKICYVTNQYLLLHINPD